MNLSTFLSAVKDYPRGVIEEFHKIDWPEWQETRQLTVAVVIIVAIATVFVGAIDFIFTRMTQVLLG
ncbi:preprotein translocase subunit SecE [Candidatus Woesebacteria bacterium]|nr:preprotein translocase subunit SecE [Candidatus Woesebacteria bacterium]MCD8527113.1 preprotein translocase subunit SecE [Candidatus Woesebacteria bacterium]MCD8546741.1 preprotein translocase subunit SecE [Candidatus Woesebacteria bacterium]